MVPTLHGSVDHPAWYVHVTDPNDHPVTYWVRGPHHTPEGVMEHVRAHYRGVTPVSCERCYGPPSRVLRPIPPTHFQFGILAAVRRELRGEMPRGGEFSTFRAKYRDVLVPPLLRKSMLGRSALRPSILTAP